MSENRLNHLKPPAEYLSAAQQSVFPSKASIDWYIRINRERLEHAGAVVTINRRVFLDVPKFETAVTDISRCNVDAEAA